MANSNVIRALDTPARMNDVSPQKLGGCPAISCCRVNIIVREAQVDTKTPFHQPGHDLRAGVAVEIMRAQPETENLEEQVNP